MFKENFISLIISIFITVFIFSIIFPDLIIFGKYSFMNVHDAATHYNNVFIIVSDFFNGGVQFWNRFDQVNTFFVHLSYGIYNVQNIITAFFYIILNYYLDFDISFHNYYSFTFLVIGFCIRSIGFYLLLNLITNNKYLSIFGTVISNIFLTYHLSTGLVTTNLLSYLPLLIYIVINFFNKFSLDYLLLFVLVLSISISTSPLMALGYFYMSVHAFIISMIIYFFFNKEKFKINVLKYFILNKKDYLKIFLTIIISLLILLPYFYMLNYLSNDFFIPDSGLGKTEGRLKQIMNPIAYFDKEIYVNSFNNIINDLLNFDSQKWQNSWLFLNSFLFPISIFGLLFSKNNIKFPFFITIVYLLFLNFPNQISSPFSIFHWITVLTNPFSFLLRSYHMTNLIIPFFIAPLFILGIQEIIRCFKKNEEILIYKFLLILILYTFICFYIVDVKINNYIFKSNLILFFVSLFLLSKNNFVKKYFTSIFIIILISYELFFLSKYINIDNPNMLQKITFNNSHIVNYSDPKNLNFDNGTHKSLSKDFSKYFREWSNPIFYGAYYEIIHYNNFKKSYLYNPVHKSFKDLHEDIIIQNYILKNNELLSFKKNAYVKSNNNNLKLINPSLLKKNKNYFFINSNKDKVLNNNHLSELLSSNEKKQKNINYNYNFNKKDFIINNEINNTQILVNLPKNYPKHVSTSLVNEKNKIFNLKFVGLNKKFNPGYLKNPNTFDVNNIKKNKLIINIGKIDINKLSNIELNINLNSNIIEILKNTKDNLIFNYYTDTDGFLIYNHPYDTKWTAKVNNKISNIYHANKYFMAVNLNKGINLVEFRYMENSILRYLIFISVILVFISLFFVFYFFLKKNNKIIGYD